MIVKELIGYLSSLINQFNTIMLISIVIPAYNEEKNIAFIATKVLDEMSKLMAVNGDFDYEVIFVNDGSKDNTALELKKQNEQNDKIHFINLSRNFGHQSALRCGLENAKGDAIISMDADLQHPPELIAEFIQKYKEGYNIVYSQRLEDKSLPFLKKITSNLYYSILNLLSDTIVEKGTADFRLIDKSVAEVIKKSTEYDLFLRGFIGWVGFKQFKIEYSPNKRSYGETKYTFRKMFNLALNGILSFSIRPLRLATVSGAFLCFFSFLYAIYAVYLHFFTNNTIQGWTSVLLSILFIGGFQLFVLGIIGEYIGKLFIQAKNRPNYIIQDSSYPKI
jgi:polyisoprenyl-phosphate glycosyltransferase